MDHSKRIRLVFKDDDILNETQKSEGLNRSWVLLQLNQHATISDVSSHLLHTFQLHQSCPHGLLLSISGFRLPPFESACIFKDDEIVRVRKRRDPPLCIEGNHAANEIEKLEAVEKQPVNTGVLLLANEEFQKEKGGYESDDPDEESEEGEEEDVVEDIENISGGNAKNRKRKAPEKLQGSKRKKQRSGAPGDIANGFRNGSIEKSHQDAESTKKKKKSDSNADDKVENNEESSKSSDKNDVPMAEMKRDSEVQENSEETADAKKAPKEPGKVSRNTRRKKAQRRFRREMAKIQKENATRESESLRNWKEDQAKATKKKVGCQVKGLQKWKRPQNDAETNEVDGQPKGLLHWKQSPRSNQFVKGKKRQQRNQNGHFRKCPTQNGDLPEQPYQNVTVHGQPDENGDRRVEMNKKISDVLRQPNKEDGDVQEKTNTKNSDVQEQQNSENDEEDEVVPIVIRPGHIRFAPLGKEEAVKENEPLETFQWNGITSKKKGQKWGMEKTSSAPRNDHTAPRNDYTKSNKEHSEMLISNEKEKQLERGIDFDKLPPLPSVPEEGDIIAYRILELSSSWTPELSAYQVGKVSWYDPESHQTLLLPMPEYPIVTKRAEEDGEIVQDNSLYKDDGSLEIDFSSLVEVRIVNGGRVGPRNEASSLVNEGLNENAPKTSLLSNNNEQTTISSPGTVELHQGKETQPPTSENGGVSLWDQISAAINAKKEQLCKETSWGETPKKVQPPQGNSWGENAKSVNSWGNNAVENSWGMKSEGNGSWGKNAKKVQPPQQNNWGNKVQPSQQNTSGGKSWSYRALRGSALGPTMAMLRSKN